MTNDETRMTKHRHLLWLCAVVSLVPFGGCNGTAVQLGGAAASQAGPPRVQTITVGKQDLEQTIEMPGTVEGFETAEIYAKVGGYLEEILVDIGDRVMKDTVIARLSIPEMGKELDRQNAAVTAANALIRQAEAGIRQREAEQVSSEDAIKAEVFRPQLGLL